MGRLQGCYTIQVVMKVEAELAVAVCCWFFFFQAEDGIRDYKVTGVQTCALPISGVARGSRGGRGRADRDSRAGRAGLGRADRVAECRGGAPRAAGAGAAQPAKRDRESGV